MAGKWLDEFKILMKCTFFTFTNRILYIFPYVCMSAYACVYAGAYTYAYVCMYTYVVSETYFYDLRILSIFLNYSTIQVHWCLMCIRKPRALCRYKHVVIVVVVMFVITIIIKQSSAVITRSNIT